MSGGALVHQWRVGLFAVMGFVFTDVQMLFVNAWLARLTKFIHKLLTGSTVVTVSGALRFTAALRASSAPRLSFDLPGHGLVPASGVASTLLVFRFPLCVFMISCVLPFVVWRGRFPCL